MQQEGKIHRVETATYLFYNKAVPKKRRKRSLFTEWERPVGEHAAKQFKEETHEENPSGPDDGCGCRSEQLDSVCRRGR